MIRLNRSLSAWGTADFEPVLREGLERLGLDGLPLQQGLSVGSHALGDGLAVMILGVAEGYHQREGRGVLQCLHRGLQLRGRPHTGG